MTIVKQRAATPQHLVDRARELAPEISGRAAEVEAARRVPRDLLDELIGAGCFRAFLPRSHGGIGADLPSGMLFSLMIASVAIGTAQGALNDIVALAEHKVPLFAGAPVS